MALLQIAAIYFGFYFWTQRYGARLDIENFGFEDFSNSCTTNNMRDFVPGTFVQKRVFLCDVMGSILRPAAGYGTVRWILTDDNGTSHTWIIKNVLYFPGDTFRVLSFPHWRDEVGDGIATKINFHGHFNGACLVLRLGVKWFTCVEKEGCYDMSPVASHIRRQLYETVGYQEPLFRNNGARKASQKARRRNMLAD